LYLIDNYYYCKSLELLKTQISNIIPNNGDTNGFIQQRLCCCQEEHAFRWQTQDSDPGHDTDIRLDIWIEVSRHHTPLGRSVWQVHVRQQKLVLLHAGGTG